MLSRVGHQSPFVRRTESAGNRLSERYFERGRKIQKCRDRDAMVQLGGLEPPTSCSTVIGLASFDGSCRRTPPQKAPFYLHLVASSRLHLESKWLLGGC